MYNTLTSNRSNIIVPDPLNDQQDNAKTLMYSPIQINIDEYCKSRLPMLEETQKFLSPFCVEKFLSEHDNFVHEGTIISTKKLIVYLCDNNLVPYKQTALYRIAELYHQNGIFHHDTWTEISTRGRKPFLSSNGFNDLVNIIEEETTGGITMPLWKVKQLVHERIVDEWEKVNSFRTHLTIPRIHHTTLHMYATRIISQNVFNVHS